MAAISRTILPNKKWKFKVISGRRHCRYGRRRVITIITIDFTQGETNNGDNHIKQTNIKEWVENVIVKINSLFNIFLPCIAGCTLLYL